MTPFRVTRNLVLQIQIENRKLLSGLKTILVTFILVYFFCTKEKYSHFGYFTNRNVLLNDWNYNFPDFTDESTETSEMVSHLIKVKQMEVKRRVWT